MSNKKRKFEQERFEFMLRINGHPICQRYFDIRNFNEDSINSMEMKELMDLLVGMNNSSVGSMGLIPDYLKGESRDYLWGYYNPWKVQKEEDVNKRDIFEKEDTFTFEFRVDDRTVAESTFTGNYFPPKVRYQVNIKKIIPAIISEIRDYLSKNSYTESYGGVELKYDYKEW
jgi:hypothetical protein